MSIHALALVVPLALSAPTSQDLYTGTPEAADQSAPVLWRVVGQDRAWLGVSLGGEGDLQITEVHDGSPADRAGLRPGDRILSIDKDRLEDYSALSEVMGSRSAGDQVRMGIARKLPVAFSDEYLAEDGRPLLGVYLDGNQVTGLQDGHPAEAAGVLEGDRILAIGGERTDSYEAIVDVLREAEGDAEWLTVGRGVRVELGAWPAEPADSTPEPRGEPRGFFRPLPETSRRPAPEAFPAPRALESSGLRSELRALSEEIASLRQEIASLRAQIQAMHGAGQR